MSYNYPFTFSRHLNPRASGLIVFGGGGGGTSKTEPLQNDTGVDPSISNPISESDSTPGKPRIGFGSMFNKEFNSYKQKVNAAIAGAGTGGMDAIAKTSAKIAAAKGVPAPSKDSEKASKWLAGKLDSLGQKLKQAQGDRQGEKQGERQRERQRERERI